MATYTVIRRDQDGNTSTWTGNSHRGLVAACRYDHQHRGAHLTMFRNDNGNVVLFLGADLRPPHIRNRNH